MSRPICRAAISACLVACAAAAQAAGIIDLGLSDEFTLSQPVVQVQVGRFGPLDLNEYLLDTGAQQCILSKTMAFDLGLDVNDE